MGEANDRTTEGLARGARGDAAAFARLVERIRGRLNMWIALRMGSRLRSRLTEDDVFQETLLQAHRSIADFRDEGAGSFRRWIFSVAENRLRDLNKFHTAQKRDVSRELTPRNREETVLLERISHDGTSPSSGAHKRMIAGRVQAGIERLPEELREVLVLRAIEERTFVEIAERLGKPATTIQGAYARALKALRDELS